MPENDFRKLPPILALLLVALGVLLSYIFADTLAQQSRRDFDTYIKQQTATAMGHVSNRLREYEQLLLDNVGIFNIRHDISRQEWKQLIDSSKIPERFPSLLGIGYVEVIKPADLASHEESVRASGAPQYAVRPVGPRDMYTSIVYLEPSNAVNDIAIGYDMYSEAQRRDAMDRARDTDSVQMSGPIHLVQDAKFPERSGIVIFYPIYVAKNHATVQERRDSLRGYVYIVSRPQDIMGALDTSTVNLANLGYTLKDVQGDAGLAQRGVTMPANSLRHDESLAFTRFGRTWQIDTVAYQPALQRLTGPGILMILGTIVSILLGIGVYRLLKRTFEKLIITHEETLAQTKNDLLAIASHQLRTPASGVKQYLGILTQGFVGELTEEQHAIARKAYNANERQLETINQILHVAKADADQISIEPMSFDIVEMVKSIIEELRPQAAQKDIVIHLTTPNTCSVLADERYINMAIENLISNAIKYSNSARDVTVAITQTTRHTKVIVKDRGVGVKAADIDKLFVKFSRVDNTRSRQEGGTGLGLFLARHIARAHRGDITVVSRVGKGSTFTLILPRRINIGYKRS